MEAVVVGEVENALNELRAKLTRKDARFGDVLAFFLERLGSSETFLRACEAVPGEVLAKVVGECARRYVRKPSLALVGGFMRYPGSDFYHGSLEGDGTMAAILFFERSNVGLVAFSDALLLGPADYVRFRCVEMPGAKAALPN